MFSKKATKIDAILLLKPHFYFVEIQIWSNFMNHNKQTKTLALNFISLHFQIGYKTPQAHLHHTQGSHSEESRLPIFSHLDAKQHELSSL